MSSVQITRDGIIVGEDIYKVINDALESMAAYYRNNPDQAVIDGANISAQIGNTAKDINE